MVEITLCSQALGARHKTSVRLSRQSYRTPGPNGRFVWNSGGLIVVSKGSPDNMKEILHVLSSLRSTRNLHEDSIR
jgi:hypothetical protein